MTDASASGVPQVTLNNAVTIPQIGFGVFQVPAGETLRAAGDALAAGYRHIDTAKLYGNEKEVGEAIVESDIPRDDVFVTTKVWNDEQGYDATMRAFDRSLDELGFEVVDLYLIHWPMPKQGQFIDSWRALEKVYADGRARSIGVSNFEPAHLRQLMEQTDIVPAVNQIELHPWLQQSELREFHAEHGIVTEAWSPLARGGDLLQDPAIGAIGKKHSTSPGQVVLRWHVQLGNVLLPRSVTPSRVRDNLDLFGFELDAEDLQTIAGLDSNTRIGPHPDTFGD